LSFQPYIGSNREDIPNTNGTGYFEAEGIAGIDVKYAAPGFLIHGSKFHCRKVNTFGGLTDQATSFGFNVDVNLNGVGRCDVSSVGFNIDMSNVVAYAEWTKRETSDTLARPFGDTKAWYTTLGYRIGKWLPHITYALIEGKASTYSPGAVSCAASGSSCVTPLGTVPAGTPLFNFPVPLQSSVTAGLRYEVNDSAALKMEYSLVDVNTNASDLADSNNPFGINYGLFTTSFTGTSPTKKVGIASVALDVIF
jgi:hypothetical protein